jgi:hypothetical protein
MEVEKLQKPLAEAWPWGQVKMGQAGALGCEGADVAGLSAPGVAPGKMRRGE